MICLIGGGAGALVIAAGMLCSTFGAGRLLYTADDAKEYEAASSGLHAATSGHSYEEGHGEHAAPAGDRKAAVAAARQRFERAQATLETARFAQQRLGPWLIGTGLAATIIFGIGYLASRGESD